MRSRTALLVIAVALLGAVGALIALFGAPASEPAAALESGQRSETEVAPATERIEAPRTGELNRVPATILASDDASPVPESPSPRIVLRGRVSDSDGRPLGDEESVVTATNAISIRLVAPVRNGSYSLEGLGPGTWYIGCYVAGYVDDVRTIRLEADDLEHREDFSLQREWMIAVRLFTELGEDLEEVGKREQILPLWAVEILASKDSPESRWTGGSLALRRAHRISHESSGEGSSRTLVVSEKPPITVVALACGVVLASKAVDTYVDSIDLTIPMERLLAVGCSVVARVTDADSGVPIPGVRLDHFSPRVVVSTSDAKRTDPEGIVRAENLLPGSCTILLAKKDYAPRFLEVDLEPGKLNDLGTIVLERGVRLDGRFIGVHGGGVVCDVWIQPFVESNPLDSLPRIVLMKVDVAEDGSFLVENLNRGKHLVQGKVPITSIPGPNLQSRPVLVDLASGSVSGLEMLVRQTIEVLIEPRKPEVRDLLVYATTAEGLPCLRTGFPNAGPARIHLVPGSYELLLDRDGTIVKRIPFLLGEEPMTLEVDL